MVMVETAEFLIKETHATMAYTQSDEITLAWPNADLAKDMLFGGRVMKMVTDLAAATTAKFIKSIGVAIPEKAHLFPRFDARVYQYPNLELAAEAFLWREADATRNSLTMATRAHYPHQEMHKANYALKHDMLYRKGINWADYPAFFKRGSYVCRQTIMKTLTERELSRIPAERRPSGPIERNIIGRLDMPPLSRVTNVIDVLFYGAKPLEAPSSGVEPELEILATQS